MSMQSENDSDTPLRLVPRQKRAGETIAKIEAATRQVLADPAWGRDRLNTNQVAKLAGVSIGTIYRYFPDRFALLDHIWPDRGSTYLPLDPADQSTTSSSPSQGLNVL